MKLAVVSFFDLDYGRRHYLYCAQRVNPRNAENRVKSTFFRYILSGIVCVSLSVQAGSAFALTFEEAVAQAKTAYEAGDFTKAVDLLIQANRLQPNSRLLLNIARSYVKAGDCARGVAYYRAFARSDESDAGLLKTAKKESDALKCTTFDRNTSGRVFMDSVPTGAKVFIDDAEVGFTPMEVVLLPIGTRKVRFEKEGFEVLEKDVTIEVDVDVDVAASLVEKQPEPVVVEEPVVEAPPEVKPVEKDMTPYYIAGGVTGVGVGLLVMGAVYDLSVIPATDDEREKWAPNSPEYQDLTDERSSEATMALVGYVGGGLLTVGGAAYLTYLLMNEDAGEKNDDSDAIEKRLGVVPVVGQGTVGLGLFGQF